MTRDPTSGNAASRFKKRIYDNFRIVDEGEVLEIGYYPIPLIAAFTTAILLGLLIFFVSQHFGASDRLSFILLWLTALHVLTTTKDRYQYKELREIGGEQIDE